MQCLKVAVIVLLGAICAMARITEELQSLSKTLAESCHEELGGELPENFAARMSKEYIKLNSETAKCHILCLSIKLGTLYEDGTINKQGLTDVLATSNPIEKVKEFVELCAKLTEGETKCQRAYSAYECYYKNKHILDEESKPEDMAIDMSTTSSSTTES